MQTARAGAVPPLELFQIALLRVPDPSITPGGVGGTACRPPVGRRWRGGRASPTPTPNRCGKVGYGPNGHAPLRSTRLHPSGVGVGLALPLSRAAEMRGRQAVPLQRRRYRRIRGVSYSVDGIGDSAIRTRPPFFCTILVQFCGCAGAAGAVAAGGTGRRQRERVRTRRVAG